jgi:hypothetical protein
MSDERERVYTFKPEPKPGIPCPRCHGMGTNPDGSLSIGTAPDGTVTVRERLPSKCHLCAGSGRVTCTPATQAGGAADE